MKKGRKTSGRATSAPPPREITLLMQRILGVFLLCVVIIILLVLGINFFREHRPSNAIIATRTGELPSPTTVQQPRNTVADTTRA